MMNKNPFINFKFPNLLTLLAVFMITLGLFLSGGQSLSWAAPEQSPHMQTVPPRPTETPSPGQPTAPPAQPTAPAQGTPSSQQPSAPPAEEDTTEVVAPTAQIPAEETQPEAVESNPDEVDAPQAEAEPTVPEEDGSGGGEVAEAAQVTMGDQGQGNGGVNEVAQDADLSLLIATSNTTLQVGEIMTFDVVVSNNGPADATEVIIRSPLPEGLTLVETTATRGSYDETTGQWAIDVIANNEVVTLSLTVVAEKRGSVTGDAEVYGVAQFDPDSTPNNDLELEDDQDTLSLIAEIGAVPVVQAEENDGAGSPAVTTSESEIDSSALADQTGTLYWLLALAGGVMFVFVGWFLVRRS